MMVSKRARGVSIQHETCLEATLAVDISAVGAGAGNTAVPIYSVLVHIDRSATANRNPNAASLRILLLTVQSINPATLLR